MVATISFNSHSVFWFNSFSFHINLYRTDHCWRQLRRTDFICCATCCVSSWGKVRFTWVSCEKILIVWCDSGGSSCKRNEGHCGSRRFAKNVSTMDAFVLENGEPNALRAWNKANSPGSQSLFGRLYVDAEEYPNPKVPFLLVLRLDLSFHSAQQCAFLAVCALQWPDQCSFTAWNKHVDCIWVTAIVS